MNPFAHGFIVAEHDARRHRVIEVSAAGSIVRQFAVEYPLDLELQADGHLLLSSNRAIIELDGQFREVWRFAISRNALFSCQRLANGNVLCGDTSQARICEVDRRGRVVRAMPFPYSGAYQPAYDMFRIIRALPDGNLLVACHHDRKVAEFTWDGAIAWEAAVEGAPYMPMRLPDGRTLVSLGAAGLIVELDRRGSTLWRYDMVADGGLERGWIAGISRLGNGNLVYSDSKHDRLVEIAPDKRTVGIFQDRTVLLHPSTHVLR